MKKVVLVFSIFLIFFSFTSNIYATDKVMKQAESFIELGKSQDTAIDTDVLKDTSDQLYNVLFSIGIVIAFIVGLILGIKFIVASLEEKAQIKQMVIAYVAGVVVLFGAFTIWKILLTILQS